MKNLKVILSGGGTAGHIYPALAIGKLLKERGCEVLFVGAIGKMEMEKVPQAGFEIIGLPIEGLQRKLTLQNLVVALKMVVAMGKASKIISNFKPDVVVGFGGYASAPILKAAQRKKIRTIIHESNSYAGVANRMLAQQADVICCGYEGMERFFEKDKIVVTGTPLRVVPNADSSLKESGLSHFELAKGKKTILITGGSLGTRNLNEVVLNFLTREELSNVQLIWQTGKYYNAEMVKRFAEIEKPCCGVKVVDFIDRMDYAYSVADLVICRSGAATVSELELLGKAAIFVPSPNVAEDHQTKNAASLVEAGAALMVRDDMAMENLFDTALELLSDSEKIQSLVNNIKLLAKPNAGEEIVRIIEGVEHSKDNIFFVGIGGIGMSALARFFKHDGYKVFGYDLTKTPLTEALENEGIKVFYEDTISVIPKCVKSNNTKVIYTPAIPKDSKLLNYFFGKHFDVCKRSQALGLLCNDKFLFAVAGTHGKTTTSSMAAHFMSVSTDGGSAFLGGIAKNFGSNLVMGEGNNMVVEADEFDRSFLRLTPNSAVITAADPDHLDIYKTAEEFKNGFEDFISKIKPNGKVIIKKEVELDVKRNDIGVYSYSLDDKTADYYANNLTCDDYGRYEFDIVTPTKHIEGCKLGIAGLVNVENCIAAVALIDEIVFNNNKLRSAIASYSGVARRFDMWVKSPKAVYMDDYAHHPDELKAMLNSVRAIFPDRHITIAFQPHLYSRTKDFAKGFAESLSIADRAILIPIYPARELPIEGVTSKIIYDDISCEKMMVEKEELNQTIEKLDFDILITAGAGNIDQHCSAIAKIVQRKVESQS